MQPNPRDRLSTARNGNRGERFVTELGFRLASDGEALPSGLRSIYLATPEPAPAMVAVIGGRADARPIEPGAGLCNIDRRDFILRKI